MSDNDSTSDKKLAQTMTQLLLHGSEASPDDLRKIRNRAMGLPEDSVAPKEQAPVRKRERGWLSNHILDIAAVACVMALTGAAAYHFLKPTAVAVPKDTSVSIEPDPAPPIKSSRRKLPTPAEQPSEPPVAPPPTPAVDIPPKLELAQDAKPPVAESILIPNDVPKKDANPVKEADAVAPPKLPETGALIASVKENKMLTLIGGIKTPKERIGPIVILDGTPSQATTSRTLSYEWKQVAGNDLKLPALTRAKIALVIKVEGDYRFQLIVSSGDQQSAPVFVDVTIAPLEKLVEQLGSEDVSAREAAAKALVAANSGAIDPRFQDVINAAKSPEIKQRLQDVKLIASAPAEPEFKNAEAFIEKKQYEEALAALRELMTGVEKPSGLFSKARRRISEVLALQGKWKEAAEYPTFLWTTMGPGQKLDAMWPGMKEFLDRCVANGADPLPKE